MIFYCEIANSQICFRANIITSPLAIGTTLASHVPGPVNHLPKMHRCASDHCKSRIDIFHAKPPRLDHVVGVDQVVKIVCRVHGGHLVHEVKLRLGNVRKCWRHRVVAVKRNVVASNGHKAHAESNRPSGGSGQLAAAFRGGGLAAFRGRAVATVLTMRWHDWAADQGRKRRRRAVKS